MHRLLVFLPLLPLLCSFTSAAGSDDCPKQSTYGKGPPSSCTQPIDPNNMPRSALEDWFTEDVFNDLFPWANIGWGPNSCFPYSYQSFVIAARYFPGFGTTSPDNGYDETENARRDVAAFFAHAVQETGLNDIFVYTLLHESAADDCFYRGGLFNWFEGGPVSAFLNDSTQPAGGDSCNSGGTYCSSSVVYPCVNGSCYFGRGTIQISYNYNYGQFQDWLAEQNVHVDLLKNPNLVLTKTDPPLALMASLWFYMTPQPPKPAMHDIVLGQWHAGSVNEKAGYFGPIFGPTSLVINNECNGMDAHAPGGGGENRRIRAFIWFCGYFGVPTGANNTLTCKGMPQQLDQIPQNVSYQPDWSSTWRNQSCNCTPASYGGNIFYYQPGYYPEQFVALNAENQRKCVDAIYSNPKAFGMDESSSACLSVKPQKIADVTAVEQQHQKRDKSRSFVTGPTHYLQANSPVLGKLEGGCG